MADGGNREPGDVKEKKALNPLFSFAGAVRPRVCWFCEPKTRYSSRVMAIELVASERSRRSGRMVGGDGDERRSGLGRDGRQQGLLKL